MRSSGADHGAQAVSRHLKVLLPSSSEKLRIWGELARRLDGDAPAMLVSPLGSKVWRVEVERDDGGAFLGGGWPEFVAAHGLGVGWFLVLRHEGGGGRVLTVKAFDTTCCLRDFSRPINVAAHRGYRRPQFIKVLTPGFTEKMVIPREFTRHHITGTDGSSRLSALLNLSGKFCGVDVEKDRVSGTAFFSGVRWSRFAASAGVTEGEVLLLRYEGNLVFTVKASGFDGCQKVIGCKTRPGGEEPSRMMSQETDQQTTIGQTS